MNTIETKCNKCGKIFHKSKNYYNRTVKKGQKHYCSLNCSPKAGISNFKGKRGIYHKSKHPVPFSYYLRNCRRRNKEFDLNSEYLVELWNKQEGKCAYTHIPLTIINYKNSGKVDFRYAASIDRIDSNKGYIQGNVQFISTSINFMKNKMSDEQTKEFISLIRKSNS